MLEDREQLEFAISQYVDGTLSAREAAELEARLRSDPEAAELLREFLEIDAAVKAPAELPSINWDELANRISARIEEETAKEQTGPESLPMPWVRTRSRSMLIAASVLIAAGIAIKVMAPTQQSSPNVNTDGNPRPTAIAMIQGPMAEKASAPAIAEVAIGPAPTVAGTQFQYHAAEAILMEPSQVVIQSDGNAPPQLVQGGLFQ